MNFRQLEAFQEVMLTGSVSEAARNMGRTQPAISSTIAGLEAAIGCALFERRGGRLHPLPEAHYLFEEAKTLLGQLGDLDRTMAEIRDAERGMLRIASMSALSLFFLPRLIASYTRDKPDVRVALMNRTSPQVIQSIASQQYDIGFADMGVANIDADNPLVKSDWISVDWICAVPTDLAHARSWQRKAALRPADLDGQPLAGLFPDHAVRTSLSSAFEDDGATLDVRYEGIINAPLLSLVHDGVACAIVDPLSAAAYRLYRGDAGRIVFRPFLPRIPFDVAIITPAHRPSSRLTARFLEIVKREIVAFAQTWDPAMPPWECDNDRS